MTKIAIDLPPLLNISVEAVERILAGAAPATVPVGFDKRSFASSLNALMERYAETVVDADHRAHKQLGNVKRRIRKAAVDLHKSLDGVGWEYISWSRRKGEANREGGTDPRKPDPYPEDVRVTMIRVIEDIDRFRPSSPQRLAQPPFIWLVGELASLFEQSFHRRATFHRRASDRVPESPFIRFAEQVLSECRVKHRRKPYRRESIAKALNDNRVAAREAAANVGES